MRWLDGSMAGLLAQIISPAYYRSLRTEQQLGYIVYASLATLLESPGISFVVQSPVADPQKLQTLTGIFIGGFLGTLTDMTDIEFETQKRGFVAELAEIDKSLNERTSRYWREIDRQQLAFDSQQQLLTAIQEVSLDDLVHFAHQLLQGDERRSVTVYAVGKKHADTFNGTQFEKQFITLGSIDALRQTGEFFPR